MAIKCFGQTIRTRDVIQTSRGCMTILFRMWIVFNSPKYIDEVVKMYNLAIDFSKTEIIGWTCISFYTKKSITKLLYIFTTLHTWFRELEAINIRNSVFFARWLGYRGIFRGVWRRVYSFPRYPQSIL